MLRFYFLLRAQRPEFTPAHCWVLAAEFSRG